MAKGGYRPGAGRPKKIKSAAQPVAVVPVTATLDGALEPLSYMLSVMNDPSAEAERRDRMAIAAAPYRHPRLDRVTQSKKDEAAQDAKSAAVGKFATPSPPKLIVNNK